MPKGYWIANYRSISDPAAVARYGELAGPALKAAGGRVLARGTPAKTFEQGVNQRTVLIEFDSIEQAVAAYESEAYRAALRELGRGADRDIRIIEGVG